MSDVSHKIFVGKLAFGYTFPNIVFPILGNKLIGKLGGMGNVMQLMATLILLGQSILFFSLCTNSTCGIFIGYMIYGMGAESMGAFSNSFISMCIANDSNRSFLLAISASMGRLGSSLVFLISPHLALNFGVYNCFFSTFLVSIVCFLCSLRCRYVFQSNQQETELNARLLSSLHFIPRTNESKSRNSRNLRLLCCAFICIVNAYYPLSWNLTRILISNFSFSSKETGMTMGFSCLLCIILLPLVGYLVDRLHLNRKYLMVANSIIMGLSCILLRLEALPVVAVSLIGCNYAVFASCFWSGISIIVGETRELCNISNYAVCASNFISSFIMPIASYLTLLDKKFHLLLEVLLFSILLGILFLFNVESIERPNHK